MNIQRAKVIACATVIEEMLPSMPEGMAYEVLDFGLHLSPGNLRTKLQEAIDASCSSFDTILLGYGLCSLALVGLKSNNCTLVTPRVDDCIAIFLGSREAYSEQSKTEPGTYYLTKGWIEVADTPFDEYERMVEKYGQDRSDRLMKTMLKHYTRLVYIDTGTAEKHDYVEYARKTALKFNLRFEEIQGSNALILQMLTGPWDENFLVVPPGKTITYLDFKDDGSVANIKAHTDQEA
jgi:hypothetical protein